MKPSEQVKVKLLSDNAKVPFRVEPGSSGFDLYATEERILYAHHCFTVKTGVALEMRQGIEAQVRGRSGLAKLGVMAHVGTIDSTYRGEVSVVLYNVSSYTHHILPGDRIAQLVFSKLLPVELTEVDELSETERGAKGFGSSGK